MKNKDEKNHIDEWLKIQIKKGIEIIDNVLRNNNNKWELYYTGHLQKAIFNNFPGRTSKKIFKGYRAHLDNNKLLFVQKKFEHNGYEYYVKRGI